MAKEATPQTVEKISKKSKGKGRVTKDAEEQKSASSAEKGFSLFKSDSTKDAELDDLFSKSVSSTREGPSYPPSQRPSVSQATFAVPPAPKPESVAVESQPSSEPTTTETITSPSKISKRKREEEESASKETSTRKEKKGKKAKKGTATEVNSESAPVEAPKEKAVSSSTTESNVPQVSEPKAAEDDVDMETLESDVVEEREFVHESMREEAGEQDKKKKQKKTKFVPEGESKSDRDRRTIFIGNLPVETVKNKVGSRSHLCFRLH
jgi:nucleolar protein 12